MISRVVPVEFPDATVKAAAAQNTNGSYTIYENTLLPEDERREAARELIRRIGEENQP